MEEAKVGEKVEGRRKEEEKETSFEELMGKKNKMTKSMMTNMKMKTRVRITQSQKLNPSAGGSVKQIHEQITMCVKEEESGTSRNEGPVAENESHRVDEINLFEKFQSIGVGDPRRRWLVDSGATCHIIAERWLSNYKIVLPLRSRHSCPEGSR